MSFPPSHGGCFLEPSLSLSRMMAELMAFLVIFDTIFYYCHRLLHTRNFYKYFLLAPIGVPYAQCPNDIC